MSINKRQRHSRMTTSEIMTIIIYFHTSHYQNFKNPSSKVPHTLCGKRTVSYLY